MNTAQLVGQVVEIKMESLSAPVSAVVLAVESAGLWIKGDVVEKIAVKQGGDSLEVPTKTAVFLPFATISWLMTEAKEPVYQKMR